MPDTFIVDNLPFSILTENEQTLLLRDVQRKEYQPTDILITAGQPPQGLFVIFKGRVAECEPSAQSTEQLLQQPTAFMHYETGEYFGSWSVFNGQAIHNFVAVDTTVCHLILSLLIVMRYLRTISNKTLRPSVRLLPSMRPIRIWLSLCWRELPTVRYVSR